eukprot:scaffold32998_cov54-Phaeocystis_antarctica.AAC.1
MKVYKKEYVPVYKPNIGDQTDTANFDPQASTTQYEAGGDSRRRRRSPYPNPTLTLTLALTLTQFTAEAAVDSVLEGNFIGGQANPTITPTLTLTLTLSWALILTLTASEGRPASVRLTLG